MAGQGKQVRKPGTQPLRLFDLSGGMYSRRPKEVIPANASPYCKNVLWDEKGRLSKIFGTTALLAAANNAFSDNPIYKLYNFIEHDGTENLIIQGIDTVSSAMKLWVVRGPLYEKPTSTATDITPSGVVLPTDLRCYFVTYKGKLYMLNGMTPLMKWNGGVGNPTNAWVKYHNDSYERFQYLCAWNPSHPRLWAAHSPQNPIRVIYSAVNGDDFGPYYGEGVNPSTGVSYVGNENWMDFPTNDGTPITGLAEFQKTLLVFKPRHIFRIYGDPEYGVTIACVVEGLGCVAQDSIRVRNDGTVVFMAEDGIWAGGDVQLYASPEDQIVRSKMTFAKLTTEIDDYWDSYVTVPDVFGYGSQVWAGATDFADFTLSDTQDLTPVSDKYPAQIVFVDDGDDLIINQTSVATGAVALRSYVSTSTPTNKPYYAQLIQYTAVEPYVTPVESIPAAVHIYTTKTGTIGNDHVLNCYITATKSEDDFNVPDFSKVYAEGTVSGNTDIKNNDWTQINISYYPSPQNLYDGKPSDPPLVAIVIQAEGDDDSNYVSWKYQTHATGETYGDTTTCMVNADHENPTHQELLDYGFKLYCTKFASLGTVETDGFKCTDANFVRWRSISIENTANTFNGYKLGSKMVKVEYDTGGSGGSASWTGTWTETENGGEISATDLWVKFRLTYLRLSMDWTPDQDSFSLTGIRVTWQNQATLSQLVAGEFWDDRYILACDVQDSGG